MTVDNLLHRLWTKAVGSPGYNKKEWQVSAAFIEARDGHNTDASAHDHVGLLGHG